MIPPARLVVLASGGGRTLENLQDLIKRRELNACIPLVIVSNPDAGAVQRALNLDLVHLVIGPKTHPDRQRRNDLLLGAIFEARPDYVILAGWLQLLPIPPQLEGKVINIHPALLPAYGGKGFYGHHVHEAVIRDQVPVSGCTVHFASEEYDRGPTILQEAVPVLPHDDADSLALRVFEAEKRALPQAIHLLHEGRVYCSESSEVVWE